MPDSLGFLKKVKYTVEYAVVLTASFILNLIPEHIMYALARKMGEASYRLGIRRDVARENITRAFGDEYGPDKIEDILVKSYRHIAMTFFEVALMPYLTPRLNEVVDVDGIDIAKRAIARGKGLILVSAHSGNWEINGASMAWNGIPVTVVGKRQKNPYVDKFVTRTRELSGMKMVSHGGSLRHLIAALKKGEGIGLISDQNAGKHGVFVDFFGTPASTVQGTAQLALKFGSPVIVTMNWRDKPGHYKTEYREVPVGRGDSIADITQRFTKEIESVVRLHPEQYFWMHRRWKTRPPDSKQ